MRLAIFFEGVKLVTIAFKEIQNRTCKKNLTKGCVVQRNAPKLPFLYVFFGCVKSAISGKRTNVVKLNQILPYLIYSCCH